MATINYWGLSKKGSVTVEMTVTIDQLITAIAADEALSTEHYTVSSLADPSKSSLTFGDSSTTLTQLGLVDGGIVLCTTNQSGSKQERQLQKLAIAAKTKTVDGYTRATLDTTQLPTLYSGNTVVDNANVGGLVVGRPWTTAPVVTAGSAQFSGSNYLDNASTAAFGFGTADLTIEFWWRPTVDQRSDVLDFWSAGGSGITARFNIGKITGSNLQLYTDSPVGGGGSSSKITGPTIASLLNAWHHIAITRESGAIKMWVNGTQAGSSYTARVLNMGSSMQLRIMGDHNASGNGSGNLSNVRVVTGVAVYTGAFTPSTAPLTVTQSSGTNISAITAGQTQLLLNTVDGANFLVDSSTNAITVTNNGSVTSSALNPF